MESYQAKGIYIYHMSHVSIIKLVPLPRLKRGDFFLYDIWGRSQMAFLEISKEFLKLLEIINYTFSSVVGDILHFKT